MISFTFYQTYGLGCEHLRFVLADKKKWLWQRVVKWWIFYLPVGELMREHPCNYYLEGKPEGERNA